MLERGWTGETFGKGERRYRGKREKEREKGREGNIFKGKMESLGETIRRRERD